MENERILLQAKGHRNVTPLVVTVFFVVLTGLLLAFGRGTFLGMTIFLAVFLADVVLGIISYFVRPRPVVTITDKRVHGYSYVAPRRRKRRGGNNILLAIFSVVFKAIRLLLAYLFDYGSVAKCAQECSIPLEHIKKIHFRKSHFFGKKGKFSITTNSCSIVPATFKNGKEVSDTLVQAVLATVKPERSS